MGKGLEIDDQSEGIHVAFSAGTGILVFIDLIQRILLSNLNIFYSSRERLHPEFKLVLYQSFHSRNQACCLDLIEKIMQFNDKFGFDNFHMVLRLSDDKVKESQYWDEDYVKAELTKLLNNPEQSDWHPSANSPSRVYITTKRKELKKVWVCGTPAINEMFDKMCWRQKEEDN